MKEIEEIKTDDKAEDFRQAIFNSSQGPGIACVAIKNRKSSGFLLYLFAGESRGRTFSAIGKCQFSGSAHKLGRSTADNEWNLMRQSYETEKGISLL